MFKLKHRRGLLAFVIVLAASLIPFQNCGKKDSSANEQSLSSLDSEDAPLTCGLDEVLEDNKCVSVILSCDIDNGVGQRKKSSDPCSAISCNTGYKLQTSDSNSAIKICVKDSVTKTQSCTIANGKGEQTVNGTTIGPCKAISCNSGYHKNSTSTSCDANVLSCTITNGKGEKTWNGATYGSCSVKSCNSKYEAVNNVCVSVKGYLSTSGNQIINEQGKSIRISGVNWQGFEKDNFAPNGLYAQNWKKLMMAAKNNGFNTIRLPFSLEMLQTTKMPKDINFTINSDLKNKKPLEIMDMVINYAKEIGLRVILTNHRRTADKVHQGTEVNGVWFDSKYTEKVWIAEWVKLTKRYKNNSAVIGADLFNEPHSYHDGKKLVYEVTWGTGGARDWARAAKAAASAVLKEQPKWLIFVAGVSGWKGLPGVKDDSASWWGQNLQGVKKYPVIPVVDGKKITNKVVYTPHVYPKGVLGYPDVIFEAKNFPRNMPAIWDKMFGYIYKEKIAPVWIGEFAANMTGKANNSKCKFSDPNEPKWLDAFIAYMDGDFNLDGKSDVASGKQALSWTYWAWGFDDCGRYLFEDVKFSIVEKNKIKLLKESQFSEY